ncbi:MAG: hypothetical protein M0Q99_01450 [Candidatus Cloacimonetes bacterium]|nr:hypothetical protein [Candidatus Cloacimonadota bacterium]
MARPSYISNSSVNQVAQKAIVFLALSWIISSSIYYGLNYMYMRSYGGNSGAQINHVIRTQYDAYIFGASRASHHYDPSIIEGKLGLSCFNAGDDGKNATYQFGILQMLLKKHTPKLIIYEIGDLTPSLDGGTIDLYPYYYNDPDIRRILIVRDKWAKVKFTFPLYAYNRKIFNVSKGYLKSSPPFRTGYRPIPGVMHPGEVQRIAASAKSISTSELVDSHAVSSLCSFANICRDRGIDLIFSYSPSYVPSKPIGMDVIHSIAMDYNIPVMLYGETPQFSYKPQLFKDAGHLNDNGAMLFTDVFADSLAVVLR